MKEVWVCKWETIPGNGEQTELFLSLTEAKQAMRQKIAESIDLREYLADLEPRVTKFLGNYLSEPHFPKSARDIPEEYEDPERGELYLGERSIDWDYPYDAFPRLHTTLVLDSADQEEYKFDFWYEYPEEATGNAVKALSVTICPRTEYGTSAYPLMVWDALRKEPKTQQQIIRTISEVWDTKIERKAVGRNLELLKNLGYPVQHNPDGYYWGGDFCEPVAGAKFSSSAYPMMILQVLDAMPKTQTAIIQAVQEKYGVKIDRKAVSRHLELLAALRFRVKKSKDGYSLGE